MSNLTSRVWRDPLDGQSSKKGSFVSIIERAPRRIERTAMSDILSGLISIYTTGLEGVGINSSYLPILAGIYSAGWHGRGATAAQLSTRFGLARETTRRKLKALLRMGSITKRGRYYYIAEHLLLNPHGDLDAAIKLILGRCGVLQRTGKKL